MISGPDFLGLQKLLQDRCGMSLTSDKLYLVAARLGPVAQKFGLKGVIELLADLRTSPKEAVVLAVVEAMVTHESLFFRDGKPFEQLSRIVVPELVKSRAAGKRVRVWSAACSSGQEPYSIAMQLREDFAHMAGWRWDICATDISEPILAKAKSGIYTGFEVRRGLTEHRIARHMHVVPDGHRMNDGLKAMIDFRRHNLLEPAAHLGQFDIVFCRNVLIYFDGPTKGRALELIARQMAPDGYLFLGSADTVIGVTDRFVAAGGERGMYRLAAARGVGRAA